MQDDANFANLSAAKFTELENAASPVLSSSQKHTKMEQIAERFSQNPQHFDFEEVPLTEDGPKRSARSNTRAQLVSLESPSAPSISYKHDSYSGLKQVNHLVTSQSAIKRNLDPIEEGLYNVDGQVALFSTKERQMSTNTDEKSLQKQTPQPYEL